MVEEKQQEGFGLGHIIAVGMVIAILLLGLCIGNKMYTESFNLAKSKTLDEIRQADVSDDYRQGWIDALDRIDAWYHTGSNITANDLEV